MKRRILLNTTLLLFTLFVLNVDSLVAQVTLGGSPYTQNFDGVGTALPAGWTARFGATSIGLGTSQTLVTAKTAWNNGTGNFRNVAAAAGLAYNSTSTLQDASTNRALAVRQTGTLGDPGAAFVLQLLNTTGKTNFALTFNLQSLDGVTAGRTTTWVVEYGFGAAPTSFSPVATTPSTLTTTAATGGVSWGSTSVTANFGALLDNNASNVWIRIVTLSGSTGTNVRPTTAIDDVSLSFAGDFTAPSFTSNPTSDNITESGFNLNVNLDEPGKVYYVVLADGATPPSSAEVKAGTGNGGSGTSASGFVTVPSASTTVPKTITGLLPSTSYDVWSVAEDGAANLQSSPIKIDVTTLATPPPIISPSTSSITFPGLTDKAKQSAAQSFTMTASNLTADVNVAVTGNFLVSSDNATYSAGVSFSQSLFAGNASQTVYVKFNPSGNVGQQAGTVTITSTNASDKTVALSATAIDPFNQNFNDPLFLTNSGWTQYSKIGAQVWASTNFGHTCLVGCNSGTVDKAAQINGFLGSAQNNEDWLISPQLDLTGFVNFPALSFWTISAFAGPGLQLKYSTDYPGSGDPTLSTWTTIDGKFPAANSAMWTKSSNIILPKSQMYVAIFYTSNTSAASRWTFDDWKVEDVSGYIDVPAISLAFGEVVAGSSSSSQSFTFTANSDGDITVTPSAGYEVSADNTTFSANVVVPEAEALAGKTIYVRFSPPIKQLRWDGTINFHGTALNASYGTLTGTSLPKSETFDIAAWNLEFFGSNVADGSGEFGPTDDALQVTNAITVMTTIGSDIFAVEEVSDDASFNTLVAGLPNYAGILSNRWSYSFDPPDPTFPPQKVGFVYNTSTVQLISSRVMFKKLYDDVRAGTVTLPGYPTGSGSSFWSSGRLPFMGTFDVTVGGIKKRVRAIVIHAKSGSAAEDFNRRQYDAQVLRDSLNAQYPNDNIILLGDYNDDVDMSIYSGSAVSSYNNFVTDVSNYNVLTYPISLTGATSFPSSSSLIDHIVISNDLTPSYVSTSTAIEDPRTYVTNYSNTTSDHLPVTTRFLLVKTDQTITFATLPAKMVGDANFNLTATASSGLPVSYTSSDPLIASISGNTVTILKVGTVDITASQAGNSEFNAAPNVIRQLVINKGNQTITFAALPAKTFGDPTFTLTATASSGLAVSYTSSDPLTASISGNTVTILKVGTVDITASQAGNSDYNAALDVIQPLVINKADQTITFAALPAKTIGDADFNLTATSSSGLAISYTSSDPLTASISGNTVTILKVGTVDITASQAGNANFNTAPNVVRQLVINKINQTILFGALTPVTYGDAPFDLSAVTTSSLPPTFVSSDPTIASITGPNNTVTILKAGTVNITASQAGDADFNAAPDVIQQLVINKANQTITFGALSPVNAGSSPFNLTATSSSGLTVTYTSSAPGVASISGNTVTIVSGGSTTITASQAGDGNYNAAVAVPQTLVVNKLNQTITFGALTPVNAGSSPFNLTATSSSSLTVTYTSSAPGVATISGNTVTIVGGGSTTITASQAGNGNYNAAADVTQTLVVNKLNQTITFAALSPVNFGTAPFNLAATSTSGLAVTYTSSAPAVATISGNTVTIVGGGSTTIIASQTGNGNYNAATPVSQTLVVNKLNQTITFAALSDKSMGDAPFSLTASSTSSLAVAFGTTSDKITISGTQVTIVKAGRATVTASQAGSAGYNAATPVDRSFCIRPAKPTITVSNSNTESPTLTSSASAGNQWYLNGNAINGATGATLNVTGPGAYKVQVKVDDCVSDFSNETAIVVTGDLRANGSIITYPNPAESFIEVRGIVGEVLNTQVVDMTGRVSPMILEKRDDVHRANVESLSGGIYLLRIQQDTKVHQVKFIKK